MKRTYTIILTTLLVALFATTGALAQDSGDFQSNGDGDWSAIEWNTYVGTSWVATTEVPGASDNVYIRSEDTVTVDTDITFTGNITVEGSGPETGGQLAVGSGVNVTFGDGSNYIHARDGGSVPEATWAQGSTVEFTGILGEGPDNSDQAFYNLTWNNSGQISNVSLGLGTVTIGGTVRVVDSGSNRFRLSSAGDGDGETITINGDFIVEGGAVETTGSGDPAVYNVVVNGDVTINGGTTFATSRGSGGRATWTLNGDFTVNGDAELRDSHDGDSSRVVFAGSEPQTVSISADAEYNGTINYTIASGAEVNVATGTTFHYEDDFLLDGSLSVAGEIIARDTLNVNDGTLVIADGGTYNHAYDAGVVPDATWEDGSTIAFTGLEADGPDNTDQAFYNITWNNSGQVSNMSLGLGTVTIGGTVRVVDSGSSRFRLTSAGDGDGETITINGDFIVEGGAVETTGSGDPAVYNVVVNGDVLVHGGTTFATSRGSGGRATWTLNGDFTVVGDAELRDSHEGDSSRVVFAGSEPQTVSISSEAEYNGSINYTVNSGSEVIIPSDSSFMYEDDFLLGGSLSIQGEFTSSDTLTVDGGSIVVADGGTYVHAQDGGIVPDATWETGSTIKFTALEAEGPANANQDFYNIEIDVPDLVSNSSLGMTDNTIGGDIHVVSTGTARIYLSEPAAFDTLSIEIHGDITMEEGAFSSNGTGNGASEINIHHYGNITVNGGNFSISRGSGPIVNWYLYEGGFTFNAGETQNSNPRAGGAFIFAGEDTVQHLDISSEVDISHLPIKVVAGAYLDMGTSNLSESGDNFTLEADATLASADSAAFSNADGGNLELGGSGDNERSLSTEAHYVINGSEAQATGFALPLVVASLTIDNEAGVTQSRMITINEALNLVSGVFDNTIGFTLGADAVLNVEGGSLLIPIGGEEPLPIPEPPYEVGDTLNYNGSFTVAELGDSEVDAWLLEGIAGTTWEVVDDAADGDGKAIAFDVTHEGENWYSTQAVNEPINVVEGERYTASIYLKGDADGREVRFYAGMPESGGYERVRGWDSPVLELTTEWTEYSFDFTATEAHATNGMRLAAEFNAATNDGGTIYIDNATLIKQEAVSNEVDNGLPTEFALSQNYPNPFNPTTNINYDVPEASDVKLQVFDITGRQVAELVNTRKSAGSYTVQWNAQNFATGVYIYRLTAGDFTSVRKLTLIK